MKKISSNIKIELTEEEVKLIKNICELWNNLNDEFEGEIDEIEFTSFLCNVANDEKYTWLDHEEVEIIKEKVYAKPYNEYIKAVSCNKIILK